MMEQRKKTSVAGGYPGLLIFLLTYASGLAWLLPKLSLWLDEITDLTGARLAKFGSLIVFVRGNPGAVPLGYFAQAAAIRVLGMSAFSGRLPSALSSVASCAGIYFLMRRAGARWPLLGVLVFALCPLQLRYALEARGYALALALSIWSTVLFFRILERPRAVGWLISYGLCVTAGLYAQPYSVFVPLAHLVWLLLAPDAENRRRLLVSLGVAIAISGLLFLPWYLYYSDAWRASIKATDLQGKMDFHAVPMVLREIVGAGYIGTGIFLAGILLVAKLGKKSRSEMLFWLLYLLMPIACVIVVDSGFGYFLAIRQMLFVLPPLFILFTLGVETLAQHSAKFAMALGMAFLASAMWNDVKLFTRPREDWELAARALEAEAGKGRCVLFAPADSAALYAFFLPEVTRFECKPEKFFGVGRVALAVSPYDLNESYALARRKLLDGGFTKEGELNSRGPRIELYRRD
jgi:hypothetical protein